MSAVGSKHTVGRVKQVDHVKPVNTQHPMFALFDAVPVLAKTGRWGKPIADTYPLLFGYSPFGDLFVCSGQQDAFALIATERPERIDLSFKTRAEFETRLLGDQAMLDSFFRRMDYEARVVKLGALRNEECYYPVPYPILGGSGSLETYQRGNIWVHLEIYGQAIGLN